MDHKPNLPFEYLLDYGLDEQKFLAILQGKQTIGRLDQEWAALKLLEWAPYEDIVQYLGYSQLVENWPRWRSKIVLESRKRGIDFLTNWLVNSHPELYKRSSDE